MLRHHKQEMTISMITCDSNRKKTNNMDGCVCVYGVRVCVCGGGGGWGEWRGVDGWGGSMSGWASGGR